MKIKKIILTEKSKYLEKKNNTYSFLVSPKLNKQQIRQELLKVFPNIQIKKIRTCCYQPVEQKVRYLKKFPGKLKTSLKKKALVELSNYSKKPLLEQ